MTFDKIKSKYEAGELTADEATKQFSKRREEINDKLRAYFLENKNTFDNDFPAIEKTRFFFGYDEKGKWNCLGQTTEETFKLEEEADDCETCRLQIIYEISKKNISELLNDLEKAKKENKPGAEINYIKNKIAELIDSKIKELEETKQKILNS